MESHALRERYLQKVRAVEYSNQVKENGGSEEGLENNYSIEMPEAFEATGSSSGAGEYTYTDRPSSAPEDSETYSGSSSIKSGVYYPTMGLTSSMVADYKRNAQINVGSSVSFSTDSFRDTGIIARSSGSRHANAATVVKYIETVGGISKDTNMFGTIDMNKFTLDGLDYAEKKDHGNWLRKDMLAYLDHLYNIVAPKIGVSKLQINSAYRSPRVNYDIYTNQGGGRVYWDTHMAGMAVDISATGVDRVTIADEAYKMGFGGIAIGQRFVHIDCNTKATWSYSGVAEYIKPGNPGERHYY